VTDRSPQIVPDHSQRHLAGFQRMADGSQLEPDAIHECTGPLGVVTEGDIVQKRLDLHAEDAQVEGGLHQLLPARRSRIQPPSRPAIPSP
jgi:hypothetical protein